MRVLFVASEASPLAKVGGLADVIGSLPSALTRAGNDVRVMIPRYGCTNVSQYPVVTVKERFDVPVLGKPEPASLAVTTIRCEVPIYLLGNSRYFGDYEVYGSNDLRRFLFFSRAVCEVLPQMDWQPEIVHCHDWHTALAVMWLKKSGYPHPLVFTIHNLAYQGLFDKSFMADSGLERDWRDFPPGAPEPPLNFISQGITWADLITTVSETYSREILTPEYGAGLDPLIRHRQKDLLGIVNGIDYEEYNPETDLHLPADFGPSTLEKRTANKLALQKRVNLPQDARIPLIGMVQRLDEQKGFDIVEQALPPILEATGAQLVILGRGRAQYEDMLQQTAARYPGQVALSTDFNDPLAHLIYGGCDLFLMPSRYEPCGLGQIIAMRYGALPIVRHTGGLVDTVPELTPDLAQGNGFVFRDYTPEAMIAAVKTAVDAFRGQRGWNQAVQRVMQLDFSWQASTAKYIAAYQGLLGLEKP